MTQKHDTRESAGVSRRFFNGTHKQRKTHIKSCSRAFHPKYAMGDYDDIAGVKLNTQACEQVNSCMVDIAQQAKYMSAVTYLFAIRDFLGQLNGSKPGTGRWKSVYSGLLTQDV